MNCIILEIKLFIPKTLDFIASMLFCLKCLPLSQALKMPILVSHKLKIDELHKGVIKINGPIRRFMICIGHRGFSGVDDRKTMIHIENNATVTFEGKACLAQGTRLWIENGSNVVFGDNFYCNKNGLIRAARDITFGKDVLMGWNIQMNNTDGHSIVVDGKVKENDGEIVIGNHVWIASDVRICKNTKIGSNCVVAQMSLVNGTYEDNTLVGGIPAKVIKHNIDWKE